MAFVIQLNPATTIAMRPSAYCANFFPLHPAQVFGMSSRLLKTGFGGIGRGRFAGLPLRPPRARLPIPTLSVWQAST